MLSSKHFNIILEPRTWVCLDSHSLMLIVYANPCVQTTLCDTGDKL